MVTGAKGMKKCENCSIPKENGKYCQYCVDENGELQAFEERFKKNGSLGVKERAKIYKK